MRQNRQVHGKLHVPDTDLKIQTELVHANVDGHRHVSNIQIGGRGEREREGGGRERGNEGIEGESGREGERGREERERGTERERE